MSIYFSVVSNKATTVSAYFKSLSPEDRKVIETVREVIRKRLPKGYKEQMQYGMIGYVIPLETYPETYNGQPLGYIGLAAQKNYYTLYLNNVYSDPDTREWFEQEYQKTGKKKDMGKSCLRFKKIEDLPLDLIGKVVARTSMKEFIGMYERSRP